MTKDIIYLGHIAECIERVNSKALPAGKEIFLGDQDIIDIVLRNLQIMAESTQRLTKEAKSLAPTIPWHDISDFRNILVHDYLGDIDYSLVWHIIENELPALKQAVIEILKGYNKDK